MLFPLPPPPPLPLFPSPKIWVPYQESKPLTLPYPKGEAKSLTLPLPQAPLDYWWDGGEGENSPPLPFGLLVRGLDYYYWMGRRRGGNCSSPSPPYPSKEG